MIPENLLRKNKILLHHSIYEHLLSIYENTGVISLKERDRYVIFSDLHMGNGGRNDDFAKNSRLFINVLERYYLADDFYLILNGDIEDLQRFNIRLIHRQWQRIYKIFDFFALKKRLYKLFGNHDIKLSSARPQSNKGKIYESLRFKYKDDDIFILHGHQASSLYLKHNKLVERFLRYVANPLGIHNISPSHNYKKRYHIEQRIYDFSKHNRLISIIGHTHRPLFESLSKIDVLKYRIEQLCRKYTQVSKKKQEQIKSTIREYRDKLLAIPEKSINNNLVHSLYTRNILLPCIFNSGCCIGKRGITAIELSKGKISLVYWYDKKVKQQDLNYLDYTPVRLGQSNFYRLIIKQELLDYIFTRIKLLS